MVDFTRKLGDCVRLDTYQIYPAEFPMESFCHYSIPAFDSIGGPVVSNGAQIESGKFELRQSAVLVSKLNPRKLRVQVFTPSGGMRSVASTEFMVYTGLRQDLDLRYLYHLLSSSGFARRLQAVAMGTTNSHIRVKPSETLGWPVWIPPLEDQQKIAETLDEIDEAIKSTERIISKYEDVRNGLTSELLNSDTLHASMSGVGSACLGDFVRFTRGVSWSAEDECDLPTGSTRPVLRIPNIQSRLVLDDVLFVDFPGGISEKYLASSGSILMVGSNGNPRRVGNAVQISSQDGEFYFASFLIALQVSDKKLDERYLFYWIRSDVIQDLISRSVQGSTGLANLSMGFLSELPLMLPSLTEQRRIAGILDEIEETIQANLSQLEKLRSLRTGLSADLLSGKV